jgi:hypothetical protein
MVLLACIKASAAGWAQPGWHTAFSPGSTVWTGMHLFEELDMPMTTAVTSLQWSGRLLLLLLLLLFCYCCCCWLHSKS